MHRLTSIAAAAFVMALLAAGAAHAQSTATLQGTITDAQNAVMPGVSIVIRNAATGTERAVVTDAAGHYVAASLAPGRYTIVAHIEGFKDQTTEVVLEVAQIAVVSLKLGLASLSENVTVAGASPLIETATVSVGQVMAERTVQEIPLNGRHFVDLGPLMPGGVTPPQNAGLSAPLAAHYRVGCPPDLVEHNGAPVDEDTEVRCAKAEHGVAVRGQHVNIDDNPRHINPLCDSGRPRLRRLCVGGGARRNQQAGESNERRTQHDATIIPGLQTGFGIGD